MSTIRRSKKGMEPITMGDITFAVVIVILTVAGAMVVTYSRYNLLETQTLASISQFEDSDMLRGFLESTYHGTELVSDKIIMDYEKGELEKIDPVFKKFFNDKMETNWYISLEVRGESVQEIEPSATRKAKQVLVSSVDVPLPYLPEFLGSDEITVNLYYVVRLPKEFV